ncbi:MAG: Gfo/Idh/MocA family oxidoreductase, partial [Planctomycetales bacterium]|nr:Gfo/Idh/MocA family oxidoreductase [Planctomycetales bacterium]
MTRVNSSRRGFLRSSACLAAAAAFVTRDRRALGFRNANDRPTVAVVGCGSRWDQRATGRDGRYGLGKEFPKFGDIVAVCDADTTRVERAQGLVKEWLDVAPDTTGDYRAIIDRDDIDVVHIVTPDHWHAKVAIEAMLSGKDVYCEKPMTLTIDEGIQLCEVQKRTGRVFQVGTQQRSMGQMLRAIALIRAGRIGRVTNVTCSIGGAPTSPEIPVAEAPAQLDFNQWLGPAPLAEFRHLAGAQNEVQAWQRTHYEFRWWYEYSGGKLTDWGAHHVDIATWGMGKDETGPIEIHPDHVKHPVDFVDGNPVQVDRYNTATEFSIRSVYADGMQLVIRHDGDNGILFEGTEGRIFVNRGRLTGKAVEDLESNPLPEGALEEVYGRPLTDHVTNFFSAVADRGSTVSDPHTHHRALTTCHLAGIAARLGRALRWDPEAQQIVDDPQAQAIVARAKPAA